MRVLLWLLVIAIVLVAGFLLWVWWEARAQGEGFLDALGTIFSGR